MRPIGYEVQGFPEFLRSEAACRRAIARGAIGPETPVIDYAANGERVRMLAAEHLLLRPLLGIADPPPPEPAVEPVQAPSSPVAGHAVAVDRPASPWHAPASLELHPRPEPVAPEQAWEQPADPGAAHWMGMALHRYAEFEGRSTRREYWMFALLQAIVLVAATVAVAVSPTVGGVLYGLWLLGTLLPSLAVQFRRLHDRNLSGWWLLGFAALALVPTLGVLTSLVLLAILCLDGAPGPNRFGADPKGRSKSG